VLIYDSSLMISFLRRVWILFWRRRGGWRGIGGMWRDGWGRMGMGRPKLNKTSEI
jgi:hypothetical protein